MTAVLLFSNLAENLPLKKALNLNLKYSYLLKNGIVLETKSLSLRAKSMFVLIRQVSSKSELNAQEHFQRDIYRKY